MSLVHAEYLKLTRRRTYPVMLLILAALVVLLAFFLLLFGQIAPELAEEVPVLTKPDAYLIGAQQVAAQTWFPLILAVVMLGGEFGSTVWASALTRDPRRLRQLGARFLVLGLSSWLGLVLGTAAWAVLTALFAEGSGGPDLVGWLGVGWKLGLVAAAWNALGLAAVALLRSVGPAIGAALALYFVDPLLGLWGPWSNVSLSAASGALFQVTLGGDFGAFTPGADLGLLQAVAIMAGWTALGFLLTWWGLQARDP